MCAVVSAKRLFKINMNAMYQHLAIDFSIRPMDIKTCLPILTALVCFCTYWFTAQSAKIQASFYRRPDPDDAAVRHITFTKIAGFVLMGVCPALICITWIIDYQLEDY